MNERDLWSAVIMQAFDDMAAPALKSGSTGERIRARNCVNARAWLNSTRNNGVGSFLWVCESLDFDPAKIRAGKIVYNPQSF